MYAKDNKTKVSTYILKVFQTGCCKIWTSQQNRNFTHQNFEYILENCSNVISLKHTLINEFYNLHILMFKHICEKIFWC